MLLILGACAASGSADLVVAGDEACSYSGPTTVDAGPAAVILQLSSIGHKGLTLAKLEDGHNFSDLADYLDTAVDPITDRPPWVTEVVSLELEHNGGEREGVSEEVTLVAGEYALICVEYQGFAGSGPTATALAPVLVATPGPEPGT